MTARIRVQDLSARWAGRRPHVVTRVSFETRSLVVANAIARSGAGRCTCFTSARRSDLANANLAALRRAIPDAIVRDLDTGDPLGTARKLHDFFAEETRNGGLRDMVVDVTSFRREELLIVLAVLRSLAPEPGGGSEVVYVGAESMAERLSGQVTSYHSVIGYAGVIYPSRPTRLVILMGFEFGRARSIIENYEPKCLVLGKGSLAQSINPTLGTMNDRFYRELNSQYDNVEATFEFSARDPLAVAAELEAAIKLDGTANVIIAPLHTKLSTLGAGLFAQRHHEVQVCYASVDSYNEQEYSTPGSDAYVLDLDTLLRP